MQTEGRFAEGRAPHGVQLDRQQVFEKTPGGEAPRPAHQNLREHAFSGSPPVENRLGQKSLVTCAGLTFFLLITVSENLDDTLSS